MRSRFGIFSLHWSEIELSLSPLHHAGFFSPFGRQELVFTRPFLPSFLPGSVCSAGKGMAVAPTPSLPLVSVIFVPPLLAGRGSIAADKSPFPLPSLPLSAPTQFCRKSHFLLPLPSSPFPPLSLSANKISNMEKEVL